MNHILTTTLALSAITLTGCATTPTTDKPTFPLAATPGFDDGLDATTMTIHKGDLTGTISFTDMIDDLADADVILVGEMHNHADSLDFIATTFEALIARNPDLILSMEFYERDEQIALDDYLAGITDYPQFLKAARRNEGNNPIGHLRMIQLCKENNRAVIAANSPRRYSKLARKDGFEGLQELNPRQRALIEIPTDLPTGSYADRFRDAMSGMAAHGGEDMITGFLRSQSLWDQTMAASVAAPVQNDNASVFHVVGNFHVNHNLTPGGSAMADGIRSRLGNNVKIRSLVVHDSDAQSVTPEDAGTSDEMSPGPAANYIIYFNSTEH
jgi:uncharacterized iron-regulated protein